LILYRLLYLSEKPPPLSVSVGGGSMSLSKLLRKSNAKKVFSVVLMSAIFISCFSPFIYAANKKSKYESTLSFDSTCTGATRHYDGQNIQISLLTYPTSITVSEFENSIFSKQYGITLYRKGWLWYSDKIGTVKPDVLKYTTSKWSNVGSGDYYFYFFKERNGVNIASDEVIMENY